jgi:hypothetical protein
MLNWIRRLGRQRDRIVFRYFDGRKWRVGDPFSLWRKLAHHPTVDLQTAAPMLDEGQEPESSQMLDALADVFGLHRLDSKSGDGLTDWEIKGIFLGFSAYMQGLKKSTESGPAPSPPTDSASSTSQEVPAEPESVSSP